MNDNGTGTPGGVRGGADTASRTHACRTTAL